MEFDDHDVSSSRPRYKEIVKKARQSRNKEKLNASQDESFGALRRNRKKKPALSQSFVMRQTTALSTKNKHLVAALVQSRQYAAELDSSLRTMQSNIMGVIEKLNSREVALDKCMKQLSETEMLHFNLRSQIQALLDDAPSSPITSGRYSQSPFDFSLKSRRFAASARDHSASSKTNPNKWQPDLTMVEENMNSMLHETPNNNRSSLLSIESSVRTSKSPVSTSLDASLNSPLVGVTPKQNEMTTYGSQSISRSERKRRRTTLISNSSFDPDMAMFDLEDADEYSEDGDITRGDVAEIEKSVNFGQPAKDQVITNGADKLRDEAICSAEAQNLNDDANIINLPAPNDRKGCTENYNITDNSLRSMDLTQPLEGSIVVTDKKQKPAKKPVPKKQKASKKKKRKNTNETCNKLDSSGDIYNFSSDSFLLNPDKKITISQDKDFAKPRSLPMSNITNELQPEEQMNGRTRRRRTSPISYALPSLHKKMRRGDAFTDGTFCKSLSPSKQGGKHRSKSGSKKN